MPVEERLHIEALRLLIENGKLRKCLNEYSSEFLNKTILKTEAHGSGSEGHTAPSAWSALP